MALLMLPLITFVAFRDGAANIGINKHSKQQNNLLFLENLKIINGTELILECPPASILVRTHMAPDFEHPQLVRKLNWFFEGVLVASFQQVNNLGIFVLDILRKKNKLENKFVC
ncbi:unnamed protein product [Meloidogyne enterolobii]|uniref:Uncharacterized protein n=1 Tax=Meloidogyne enterolobii TaxID=390850 RepID=A0ACB1A0C6_MELEN